MCNTKMVVKQHRSSVNRGESNVHGRQRYTAGVTTKKQEDGYVEGREGLNLRFLNLLDGILASMAVGQ